MFDIGFWEILLLFVLGLVVLGPERLPKVARTVGLWAGRARGYVRQLSAEIDRELKTEELQRQFREANKAVQTGINDLNPVAKPEQAGETEEASADKRDG